MVNKILLPLILIICGIVSANAAVSFDYPSPDGKSKEEVFREIQEFKLKYLAQEMDLKDDQKKPFFDLYEEMSKKRMSAMNNARSIEKKVKKKKDASEADYQAVTEAWNKAREEDAAITREYDGKFSKFLSQKQIYKLKSAEDSFRKKMEEIHHKRKKHGKK